MALLMALGIAGAATSLAGGIGSFVQGIFGSSSLKKGRKKAEEMLGQATLLVMTNYNERNVLIIQYQQEIDEYMSGILQAYGEGGVISNADKVLLDKMSGATLNYEAQMQLLADNYGISMSGAQLIYQDSMAKLMVSGFTDTQTAINGMSTMITQTVNEYMASGMITINASQDQISGIMAVYETEMNGLIAQSMGAYSDLNNAYLSGVASLMNNYQTTMSGLQANRAADKLEINAALDLAQTVYQDTVSNYMADMATASLEANEAAALEVSRLVSEYTAANNELTPQFQSAALALLDRFSTLSLEAALAFETANTSIIDRLRTQSEEAAANYQNATQSLQLAAKGENQATIDELRQTQQAVRAQYFNDTEGIRSNLAQANAEGLRQLQAANDELGTAEDQVRAQLEMAAGQSLIMGTALGETAGNTSLQAVRAAGGSMQNAQLMGATEAARLTQELYLLSLLGNQAAAQQAQQTRLAAQQLAAQTGMSVAQLEAQLAQQQADTSLNTGLSSAESLAAQQQAATQQALDAGMASESELLGTRVGAAQAEQQAAQQLQQDLLALARESNLAQYQQESADLKTATDYMRDQYRTLLESGLQANEAERQLKLNTAKELGDKAAEAAAETLRNETEQQSANRSDMNTEYAEGRAALSDLMSAGMTAALGQQQGAIEALREQNRLLQDKITEKKNTGVESVKDATELAMGLARDKYEEETQLARDQAAATIDAIEGRENRAAEAAQAQLESQQNTAALQQARAAEALTYLANAKTQEAQTENEYLRRNQLMQDSANQLAITGLETNLNAKQSDLDAAMNNYMNAQDNVLSLYGVESDSYFNAAKQTQASLKQVSDSFSTGAMAAAAGGGGGALLGAAGSALLGAAGSAAGV